MKDAQMIEIPLVEPLNQHFTWIEAWSLAVFHPSVGTFKRLLADPAASKKRGILWSGNGGWFVLLFVLLDNSSLGLNILDSDTALEWLALLAWIALPFWLWIAFEVLGTSLARAGCAKRPDLQHYALAAFIVPLALAVFGASIVSQWMISTARPPVVLLGVLFGVLALGLLVYELYLGVLATEAVQGISRAQAVRAMRPAFVWQSALIAGVAYLQFLRPILY